MEDRKRSQFIVLRNSSKGLRHCLERRIICYIENLAKHGVIINYCEMLDNQTPEESLILQGARDLKIECEKFIEIKQLENMAATPEEALGDLTQASIKLLGPIPKDQEVKKDEDFLKDIEIGNIPKEFLE